MKRHALLLQHKHITVKCLMVNDFLTGKKEILMSVSDFYNSVTPGSSLSHGTGQGVYTIVDVGTVAASETYENEKLPMEHKEGSSLLNEVNFIVSTKNNYSLKNKRLIKTMQQYLITDSKTRIVNISRFLFSS